jgi:hypothetical protein
MMKLLFMKMFLSSLPDIIHSNVFSNKFDDSRRVAQRSRTAQQDVGVLHLMKCI